MKKVITLLVIILMIFISFTAGWHIAKNGAVKTALSMQAKLNFSHLQSHKRLHDDLISGCISNATARSNSLIDQQKMFLAEYLQEYKDDILESYINLRDQHLVAELLEYEINWDKVLELPKCS